jgi:hypothetical protein
MVVTRFLCEREGARVEGRGVREAADVESARGVCPPWKGGRCTEVAGRRMSYQEWRHSPHFSMMKLYVASTYFICCNRRNS